MRRIHSSIGSASSAIPPMAAKLSWNETLQTTSGLTATMTAAASPRAGSTLRGLPRSNAAR